MCNARFIFTEAMARAKVAERETGRTQYVVWRPVDRTFVETDRAPLFGAYWTTDGIKHGDSPDCPI